MDDTEPHSDPAQNITNRAKGGKSWRNGHCHVKDGMHTIHEQMVLSCFYWQSGFGPFCIFGTLKKRSQNSPSVRGRPAPLMFSESSQSKLQFPWPWNKIRYTKSGLDSLKFIPEKWTFWKVPPLCPEWPVKLEWFSLRPQPLGLVGLVMLGW